MILNKFKVDGSGSKGLLGRGIVEYKILEGEVQWIETDPSILPGTYFTNF